MKKLLVFGVIVLFLGMSIPSSGEIAVSTRDITDVDMANFATDDGLPTVELIKPLKHGEKKWGCYFRNRRICNCPIVFIIGFIDLEVKANDSEGIEKVEFYVDNHLKASVNEKDENGVYSWIWNERIFFGHIIKVVAFDTDGNTAEYSVIVFIINFRFLSWWRASKL